MARTSLLLRNEHKPFYHPLAVCIKEEPVYLGEGCWSWLGCCSLFSPYFSRTLLHLFQLLCDGQNFSLIEKSTYTITPLFGSMYSGRTSILGRGVLVLVGLFQLLCPLFVQISTTTFSITM
jgi:hypothetical protein